MKYGYLSYRKHLLVNKNDRPMNLGDPIQSLAVLELFRRIGISEEDIIPLDRYDLADYDGEEVVALINGAEIHEFFAFHTRFLPLSKKIHPVFCGMHLHRDLSESELVSLRDNQPIGCRDEYTASYLRGGGIDAFLSGCLTMLFPLRDRTKQYDKVFIVDCSDKTKEYIPDRISENAEYLSQIVRITSQSSDFRLTRDETRNYHEMAQAQLLRFRDEAKLVITGRLHVATPCAAMGIPVVLVKDTFDERFRFIDRFLPLYVPSMLQDLNWDNIQSFIPEAVKEQLTLLCKNMIGTALAKKNLADLYGKRIQTIEFAGEEEVAVSEFPIDKYEDFTYCIWGVCMPNSYLLYEQMQRQFPNSRMLYAIDTWATGIYKDNIKIIHPDKIEELVDDKSWILVVAPAAHDAAHKKLICKYNFALIQGIECKIYAKLQ